MIDYLLYSQSYTFWILVIIVIILIFWAIWGGEPQEFVGLKPLEPTQFISPYVRNHNHSSTFASTAEDLWYRSDIIGIENEQESIDETPNLPDGFHSQIAPIVKPKQYESRGERQCRLVMETLYGKSFPKVRPQFLRNPETGRLLELDCYCEELGIAVEYNGVQHYKWPNYTNQSYEKFIRQCGRDQLKVDLCDLNNVYLITVPYNVPIEEIEDYIIYYLPENVQKRLLEDIKDLNDRD